MVCADCEYRQNDECCLFDDAVLNYNNTCFMDSSINLKEKEGVI